jgi:hypothetical protein
MYAVFHAVKKIYIISGLWCLIRLLENGATKCNCRISHTSVEGTYSRQKVALGSYGKEAFFYGKMCLKS